MNADWHRIGRNGYQFELLMTEEDDWANFGSPMRYAASTPLLESILTAVRSMFLYKKARGLKNAYEKELERDWLCGVSLCDYDLGAGDTKCVA